MKRVISMVLCLMLVLSLTTTAFAAVIENRTEHAYEVYQIFSGTQSEDASLGNIQWANGVDDVQLLTDLKANKATKAYFGANVETAQQVADILEKAGEEVARQFAQLAYNNRKDKTGVIEAGQTSVELASGYYLLVDITTPGPDDAKNPALLQVTNAGHILIKKKYDKPEHEKKVLQNDPQDGNAYGDAEDSPVGSEVTFRLKAEMPTVMEGFEKYKMTFHDDLSDGLTYIADSVTLTIGGQEIAKDQYTVVENPTECDRDGTEGGREYKCDLHIVIDNVMILPGYAPGCEILVTYQATLNEQAVIGDAGNPNSYRLEYSNDPNWDPEDPESGTQPTGVTPWKEVKVYTTEVEIKKVDGNTEAPLAGAEFTLEGTALKKVRVTKQIFTSDANLEGVNTSVKYWLLNDGTYTTTDPATLEDKSAYADTTTVYYTQVVTAYEDKQENVAITVVTGPDGIIKFGGLGEGEYTIKETKAPAGYNGLTSDLILNIVYHEGQQRFEYSWTGGTTGTSPSVQIDNQKGSVLPETGGMGTTLIYTIGGLMVAAAAVLLVTKKRMAAE